MIVVLEAEPQTNHVDDQSSCIENCLDDLFDHYSQSVYVDEWCGTQKRDDENDESSSPTTEETVHEKLIQLESTPPKFLCKLLEQLTDTGESGERLVTELLVGYTTLLRSRLWIQHDSGSVELYPAAIPPIMISGSFSASLCSGIRRFVSV